ncbi:PQQ-binding-like beta-propeller repeat protein [Nocardiopsis rhodophaea]|uniref:outer membrane protein assembly factor BamB family protein n=1 Tax=Nocardiopsis rhodophaea TaxID=280238 RepID=UPI00336D307E
MPKGWIAPLVGLVCVGSLVGCTAEEEADPAALDPSVISPDKLVTCEAAGNCGEAGALRWSLPLEGGYYMYPYESDWTVVLPESQAYGHEFPVPKALVHDGTLYYYEHERFRAVDANSGELLWTEEIDPKRPKAVDGAQMVGDTLVVRARATRDEAGLLYLVNPAKGSPRWQRVDVPLNSSLTHVYPANGTHVLLDHDTEGPRAGELDEYYLLDVTTGDVEWDADLPRAPHEHSLTEDALYVEKLAGEEEGEPDRIVRVDPADGRELSEFPVPGGVGQGDDLYATETGELLLGSSPCLGRLDGCKGGPIKALDAETGELLWERPGEMIILSIAERGGDTRVYVYDKKGYQSLDARTGRVVDDDASGDNEALIDAFGASVTWFEKETTPDDDPRMPPIEPFGPGVGELSLDIAAGTVYLTSYVSAHGDAVGVYLGCAPDGIRSGRKDSPVDGQECVSPRLFTVDYGV